jgi:hypothetical protein
VDVELLDLAGQIGLLCFCGAKIPDDGEQIDFRNTESSGGIPARG